MIAFDHVSVRDVPPGFVAEGSRVMLDRCYVEVGHEGEPLLFLRPEADDEGEPLLFLRPEAGDEAGRSASAGGRSAGAAAIAEAARLLGRSPRPYRARDGEWLDVELAGPVALTRRVAPEEVARDWPPARPGAPTLEVVRLRGDAAPLLDPLERLGGPPPGLLVDHAPGEPLRLTEVLAGGVRVL